MMLELLASGGGLGSPVEFLEVKNHDFSQTTTKYGIPNFPTDWDQEDNGTLYSFRTTSNGTLWVYPANASSSYIDCYLYQDVMIPERWLEIVAAGGAIAKLEFRQNRNRPDNNETQSGRAGLISRIGSSGLSNNYSALQQYTSWTDVEVEHNVHPDADRLRIRIHAKARRGVSPNYFCPIFDDFVLSLTGTP